jgi:hypothetical protein
MAFSGSQITRLGLCGISRGLYGNFTKAFIPQEKRGAGSGAKKLKKKKYRWVSIGGEKFKVASAYEEQQLVQQYIERKRAALSKAKKNEAKTIRISLAKAVKRLQTLEVSAAIEQEEFRIKRIQEDDEIIVMLLANL